MNNVGNAIKALKSKIGSKTVSLLQSMIQDQINTAISALPPSANNDHVKFFVLYKGITSFEYRYDIAPLINSSSSFVLDFSGLSRPEILKHYHQITKGTITGFLNADLLIALEDEGTVDAIALNGVGLTDTVINELFTQLPVTVLTATINVSSNPGAATCDPTIATAKGYTVNV